MSKDTSEKPPELGETKCPLRKALGNIGHRRRFYKAGERDDAQAGDKLGYTGAGAFQIGIMLQMSTVMGCVMVWEN